MASSSDAPMISKLGLGPAGGWLLLALVAAVAFGSRELAAQRAGRPVPEAAGLWISDSVVDEGRRLLVVVDPATRHAAVYHLDAASGALMLKSTRDISWDLMVDDFNAQEPRPAALKRLIQTGGTGPGDGGGR